MTASGSRELEPRTRWPHPVAAALLCCLALRWTCALVTEWRPIFPPHYFTDAGLNHRHAQEIAAAWSSGSRFIPYTGTSERVYAATGAALYAVFGQRPLAPKLLNGLASTAAAYLWYRLALLWVAPRAALLVLWMLAAWPSHVFFSSQNLKEAHVLLLSAGTLYAFLRPRARGPARGSVLLLALGFYRSTFMLLTAASLALAGAAALFSRRPGKPSARDAALASLCLLLPLLLYRPATSFVLTHLLAHDPNSRQDPNLNPLVPAITRPEDPTKTERPLSPRGLSEFRRIRQSEDRRWARERAGREIGTQIFPEVEFRSWWDVAAFLPKGAFYALFMPLPGLYPMDGKLGRLLAALENVLLLAVFLLACAAWRGTAVYAPVPLALAALFLLTGAASGLFEFDLGAASRHRLLYFPCLFPFAALTLTRRRAHAL